VVPGLLQPSGNPTKSARLTGSMHADTTCPMVRCRCGSAPVRPRRVVSHRQCARQTKARGQPQADSGAWRGAPKRPLLTGDWSESCPRKELDMGRAGLGCWALRPASACGRRGRRPPSERLARRPALCFGACSLGEQAVCGEGGGRQPQAETLLIQPALRSLFRAHAATCGHDDAHRGRSTR
jgi:hypothetical protein